ncbi:hypothetical protein AXG93_702s1300 [Marchantia polymorpha subsp. ruderalis]|uniref:ATP-dependent RNA helicase n=1 Tax=Marchantia polymorpha subsp. ruderalis TaxID=1480154 RepID=A0A176WBT4_MARPO|nr:hypothetical protein AXG93_702s1300 [Marchantia polymorpha subsp. ruderalis]
MMLGSCLRSGFAPVGGARSQYLSTRRSDCRIHRITEIAEKEFVGVQVLLSDSFDVKTLGNGVTETILARPFFEITMMTGKRRGYPGGVTKWQWKRRQFKEDRKLEQKRISRERKLYESRRREELKDAKPWVPSLNLSQEGFFADEKPAVFRSKTFSGPGTYIEDKETGIRTGDTLPGWSASRDDELQQIQKVRLLLTSKLAPSTRSNQELTASSFEKLQLSAPSLRALHTVFGLLSMTRVQEATLPIMTGGKDLLIRTRGGTDDVVASLLHAVDLALKTPRHVTVSGRHSAHVLLVFPTREQVEVAAAEARKLLMFHTGVKLQVVVGGSNIKEEMNRLRAASCEVSALSHYALKKGFGVIDTFNGEADIAHSVAKQEYVLVPMKMHLALIFAQLKEHFLHDPKGKVVVFCQTIRTTSLMAELYKNLGFCTREIHIRRKETVRARIAAEFRTSDDGIVLFTSGASVWGASNSDVTLIIQVGSPSSSEQYVRRITPTGPTAKQRACLLILMPHETSSLKQLVDCPLSKSPDREVSPALELQVQQALEDVDYQIRSKAYLAWLRYHFSRESTDSGKEKIIRLAMVYANALGFKQPPTVSRKTVVQVGLQKFLNSAHNETECESTR